MTNPQVEAFNNRYKKHLKPQQSTTPEIEQEDSFLVRFNQYLKDLPKGTKITNKELLLNLFKEHGERALEEYLKQQISSSPKRMVITDNAPEQSETPENTNKETKKETTDNKKKEKIASIPNSNWIDSYEKSFTKWVANNTFKKDGKPTKTPKRTIQTTKNETSLDIEITPINPSPTRPDQGVKYHIEKGEQKEDIAVTVTNKNPKKPLNYDYVYALVKSAKENGIEEIEFKDIKTPEFANMLMVASLQFKMKMINAPEYQIDTNAKYIPAKLRETINLYNEDKKPRVKTQKNTIHKPQREIG